MSHINTVTIVLLLVFFLFLSFPFFRTNLVPFVDPPFATLKSKSKQPNIVFILADDYGFNDVGYHGSAINTPTLDALAAKGVKLENYYVQPICTPTRSQLLSGRYQIHTGMQHGIIWHHQPNGLPLDLPTVADKLKEAGYSTHAVGKWHLGFYKKEFTPTYRGFDSYYGMVSCMDEAIANVTEALKKHGLWEDTVLVFSSDNGGSPSQGGNNYPLRGGKSSLFEGGVRAVGFVSGPLVVNPGRVSHALMHVSDWFPTLVQGVAGGSVHGLQLDGFDQWQTIQGQAESSRTELLHNIDPLLKWGKPKYPDTFPTDVRAAIRWKDWKLITGCACTNKGWIRAEDKINPKKYYKIFEPRDKNVWLFNIRKDPTEHTDLSSSRKDMVKFLLRKLSFYNSTAVPPRFPALDDPRSNPALHDHAWIPWEE